ncbi:MAG: HlyD family efflux transporter periplasmic adaptor subunit [Lentisphaeria bacterium]|nr:HlyD family efflux transporter periplasmic adaptor subunit [Lentisphaeria bacterium]
MKVSRKKITWLVILLVIGGIGAGAWFGVIQPKLQANRQAAAAKQARDSADKDRTYKVVRDDLVIGLQQGGYVNASQKHKLSLQANYRTKLLWVIDENSKVKAGDLLAKFETDELKEQIENLEIELDNLKKELDLAIESKKIQISTNAADLQAAEESLLQADDAMRKYRRFERASKRDELDLAITNAEAALETAENDYATTRDSEVSVKKDENAEDKKRQLLKDAQTKIDEKENSLNSAEDNLRVFRRYDNPSKLTRLFNAYEQAKLNLRKVKISTESKIVQSDKSIENYRRRIKRTSDQLSRYKSYMTMMELRAPVDGVVIYADPDRRWGNLDVKPGIDINKGQVLITIPEMSNLVVDFDLPEQYRSKINIGDRAVISPDSLPGVKFGGAISHIDTLPVNLVNWDSSSPKIYKSKLKLDQQSSRLVNGMSVQINIVTKTIPKTIFVPVEAVFEENDRFFVYRSGLTGPAEVDVEIGESNDNFVQIKSGLEEGDVVYLYRPYQKTQESK